MRSGLSPLSDRRILTKSGALMRSAAGIGDGSVGLPCEAPGIGSAGAAKTSRVLILMVRSEPRKKRAASATATLQKLRDFNMISSFPLFFECADASFQAHLSTLRLNGEAEGLLGVQQCRIEQGHVAVLGSQQQRNFGAPENNPLSAPVAQAFNDLKKQPLGFGADFSAA